MQTDEGKQPMQADGHEGVSFNGDRGHETDAPAAESGGESAGGAYPNPHTGTEKDADGFDGGQSGRAYHGPGVLGDEQADPDQAGQVAQGGEAD